MMPPMAPFLILALLLPGLAATPALAQSEPFRVFNRTTTPATALHAVRSGRPDWGGNLLNRGPLAPGQFHSVRLGEGAGCRFDLRLVLQNGTEILRQGADVCATRSVDMAPDPGPPPAAPRSQAAEADRQPPTAEPPARP